MKVYITNISGYRQDAFALSCRCRLFFSVHSAKASTRRKCKKNIVDNQGIEPWTSRMRSAILGISKSARAPLITHPSETRGGACTLTSITMAVRAYLDIYMGDKDEHDRAQAAYDATAALLAKNAAIYGLPSVPSELSEEQQGILRELDVHPRSPRSLSTR
ncbi:hypothetical protein OH77DRAFT_191754 [Trametes cingulata]|nr:hypothetical protein OH77DRAFT_191754 [Trametes cingulata]